MNLFEQEEEAKKRMVDIAKTVDDAQRIMTVPGVGAQTAVGMLVHIGGDIGRFKNSALPPQPVPARPRRCIVLLLRHIFFPFHVIRECMGTERG